MFNLLHPFINSSLPGHFVLSLVHSVAQSLLRCSPVRFPLPKNAPMGTRSSESPHPSAVRLQVVLLELQPVQGPLRRLVRRVRLFCGRIPAARGGRGVQRRESEGVVGVVVFAGSGNFRMALTAGVVMPAIRLCKCRERMDRNGPVFSRVACRSAHHPPKLLNDITPPPPERAGNTLFSGESCRGVLECWNRATQLVHSRQRRTLQKNT